MRQSFDGLSALIRQKLAEDPSSGQLFVFINRRRTQLKVLYFEPGGYCLWSKRLEARRFHFNAQGGDKQALRWTELKLIIEGIDLSSVRRFKRYRPGSRQRESSYDRMALRADRIRDKLGWEPGILNGSEWKAKGMQWNTFERLTAQHDAFVQISLAGMAAKLNLLGKSIEDWI